jgi:topoisomerase-4 subunit A
VRARIEQKEKNLLVIKEIPFGTNTSSLKDSILKANEKGKIKIKKIEDNTAAEVEILVYLPSGISPDKTIDALYAFTSCESSISPLACVIQDNKPVFTDVHSMLKDSADRTLNLLKRELEIQLDELEEQWHFANLERIFIENRIYRDIEEEETWEGVLTAIENGLKPHIGNLRREVTRDDIVRLTEIRIKRISKFDLDKAQQLIESLDERIKETLHHLDHLVDYTVDYFKSLKKRYGKGRERKTEIRVFDDIEATKVVIRNTKLYMNREEGFIGTSLRRDEYVTDCSDIDDIIVFTKSGQMMVTKVDSKTFIGKNIIHAGVFKKKDKRTVYNMIYREAKGGATYIKRFSVTGVTRDKPYPLTGDKASSEVLYFSANPNGEAEVITVHLRQSGSIKKLKWDLDFADVLIKGRASRGNLVSKYSVKRIEFKEAGVSTLKPRNIWYDSVVGRLNTEGRGELLGAFKGEDLLLHIQPNGTVRTLQPDMNLRFENDFLALEKWNPNKPISLVYFEGERQRYYLKRFLIEQGEKEELVLSEHSGSKLEWVSTDWRPVISIEFPKPKGKDAKEPQKVNVEDFIAIKGIKALGNQLSAEKIKKINTLDSLPYEEEEDTPAENMEVIDEESVPGNDEQGSLF